MPVVATTASIKGEEGAPRAAIERLPQPRWLPVHDSPEKSCLRAQNRPTADVKKQLSRLSGVLGERRQSISRAEWVWSGDQREQLAVYLLSRSAMERKHSTHVSLLGFNGLNF